PPRQRVAVPRWQCPEPRFHLAAAGAGHPSAPARRRYLARRSTVVAPGDRGDAPAGAVARPRTLLCQPQHRLPRRDPLPDTHRGPAMTHREAASLTGRWFENIGFVLGLYLAYLYVTAEADAVRMGTAVAGRPIPWGTIAVIG